ncbi:hypothetical protein [Paraburkholderia youngii]|uniref:hypothetical protein n=1 Tax=Paraburkholderia youngii TaxID=2782701 RepID=UPI003D1AEEEB
MMQRGKPRFEATDEQRQIVRSLVMNGVPVMKLCRHVINPRTGRPVNYRTLARVFRTEIETAVEDANAAVVTNLYRIATSPKESAPVVAAIIFWLRCKAGWRYADEAPPPAQTDEPMVENEETARRIMQEVLDEYGRGRIMHPDG